MMTRSRRSLVLTDESARHPFRAMLPPHALVETPPVQLRSKFIPTRDDIRGFASTYFAALAFMLVFIA